MPHHAGGTMPQPVATRDERRTIAMGSDVLKGGGQ
jgi:hypothetical protein